MKAFNYPINSLAASVLVFLTLSAASLSGQNLFLVGGSINGNSGSEKHAVILYGLGEGGLRSIRTLLNEDEGSLHININYEAARLAVMGSPAGPPGKARLLVVEFDRPGSVSSLDLGETYSVVDAGFLNVPGDGYYYYLTRGKLDSARLEDYAIRLTAEYELKAIPGSLLRFRESFGLAGFESDEFPIGYRAATGTTSIWLHADGTSQFLPPIPPNLRPAEDWLRIGARNRFMTVLHASGGRFLLYSEKTGWFAPFPSKDGIVGPARAIGPWLSVKLAKSEALKHPTDRKQPKIEKDLNDPKNWVTHVKTGQNDRVSEKMLNDLYTGDLRIYNVETSRVLNIHTDDANCEVLWVDDSSVYYRVNDTLYRRGISPQGLGSPERIAKEEAIWDVHWAFWSND